MPLYRHDGTVVFYVHIPKTGGTSIERALREAGAAEAFRFPGKRPFSKSSLQHMHAEVYTEAIGEGFYDYGFVIVRNPYNRFASEYRMKVVDAGDSEPAEDWARACFDRFAEFAFTRDNHIRPQHEFIVDGLDVFRFEDGLEIPLKAACDRLGLEPPPSMPHAKRGSRTRIPISRAGRERIYGFYRADFDRYGYARDDFGDNVDVV